MREKFPWSRVNAVDKLLRSSLPCEEADDGAYLERVRKMVLQRDSFQARNSRDDDTLDALTDHRLPNFKARDALRDSYFGSIWKKFSYATRFKQSTWQQLGNFCHRVAFRAVILE